MKTVVLFALTVILAPLYGADIVSVVRETQAAGMANEASNPLLVTAIRQEYEGEIALIGPVQLSTSAVSVYGHPSYIYKFTLTKKGWIFKFGFGKVVRPEISFEIRKSH